MAMGWHVYVFVRDGVNIMAVAFLPIGTDSLTLKAMLWRLSDGAVWSGSDFVAVSGVTASAVSDYDLAVSPVQTSDSTTVGYAVTIPAGAAATPCRVSFYTDSYTAGDSEDYGVDYQPTVEVEWVDGGRLDVILDATATQSEMNSAFSEIKGSTWSASTDTLEGIKDAGGGDATEAKQDTIITAIDGLSALSGDGAYTGTLTVDDGNGTALQGAIVNARVGGVLKATGTTDASGQITNWAMGAYTYDLAVRLAGYQPGTDTVTISADAWTKTVSMTAISITAPSAPSLCTVQFRVKLSDAAVSGAVCKAKLLGTNQASDGVILSNDESSDTTDAQGVAELQLVRKDQIVKGNGRYKIWVEVDGNTIASAETKIPSQSTALFEDLL